MSRFNPSCCVGYQDDLNWYAYVGNNPVNFTDPDGLQACSTGNLAQSLGNWWNASVAGFKSESVAQAVSRTLDGLPIEAAAIGAVGAIKGIGAAARGETETARVGELIATHGKTMSNKQLDKLVKDIRAEGIKEPLTVTEHQGKLHILDGHHRALAAPRAGMAEVPINRVELPWGPYKTPADLTFTHGGY